MDSSKIANWLQIVANIGILVGLLLVLVQLNQNLTLTRSQNYNDRMHDWFNAQLSLMGEAPYDALAKAVNAPEEMTYQDFIIMDAMLNRFLDYNLRNKKFIEYGLVPEDDISWRNHFDWALVDAEDGLGVFPLLFGNEWAKAWWAEQRFWGDKEFDAALNAAMEATPNDASARLYKKIQAKVTQ